MEKVYLKVGSCVMKNNKVYFYNMSFNGVFYIDMEDFSIHFLHTFSNEPFDTERMSINGSIVYENAIYFFPNNTNTVMKYDFLQCQEEFIPIKGYDKKKFGTAGYVQRGDIVYLFPSDLGKGIYIFNLQNKEIKKDIDLSKLFKHGYACGEVLKTSDECVLLNIYGRNEVIEINLKRKIITGSWIVGDKTQIYSMHFDGYNFWFLQMHSTDIYEWNKENDILQKYIVQEKGLVDQKLKIPYSNIIFLEKEVLVLNYNGNNILRINRDKKIVENYIEFPEGFHSINMKFIQWPMCFKYVALKEKVLLYPVRGNMLLTYDKVNHRISGKELCVSDELPNMEKLLEEIMMEKGVCVENDDLATLKGYMDIIGHDEKVTTTFSNTGIGQMIYQYCQ